jgi:glycosyltransferase involved in cell wall biosynthesis
MGPGVGYDYLFEKKILQKKCNVFVIHLGKYHNPKTNIFSIKDKGYFKSYEIIKTIYKKNKIHIAHIRGFISFKHLYLYLFLILLNIKFIITCHSQLTKYNLNHKLFYENPDIKKINLKNKDTKYQTSIIKKIYIFFKKFYLYSFGLFILKKAEALICFSKYEKKYAINFKKNIEILHEPNLTTVNKKKKSKKFNYYNKKDINIIYWGRLDFEMKGIDRIIKLAKTISKHDPKNLVKIYLMGFDYNHGLSKIKNLISKLNLDKKVIITPSKIWKSTKIPLIKADYSILLSRWDGFPRSLRESLYFNVPIIASIETNFSDLIQNFKCGYVVKESQINMNKFSKSLLLNKLLMKTHKQNCKRALDAIHSKNISKNLLKILIKYS